MAVTGNRPIEFLRSRDIFEFFARSEGCIARTRISKVRRDAEFPGRALPSVRPIYRREGVASDVPTGRCLRGYPATSLASERRSSRRSIFHRGTWSTFANVRPGSTGLFEEYPAERAAEVLVEDGVNEGVEGRVHVAQPEGDDERLSGYLDAREQRFRDVKDEER